MTVTNLYAPDFDVKLSGLLLSTDVRTRVLELTVETSLDVAGMFTIRLADPGLQMADADLFGVGTGAEIHMGYAGSLQPVMLGEVTAVQPSLPASGAPTLTVIGYDRSQRMRHNKPGRMTYKGLNDSLIVAEIAALNLLIPIVDPSLLPPRFSVQQTGSDWSLLRTLADRNGYDVYVFWDKLYFQFPRPQLDRVNLEWGRNLLSFEPRLSTSGQAGIQIVRGYDYELAEAIVAVLPAIALGDDITATLDRIGKNFIQQLVTLGRQVVNDQPVETIFDALTIAKAVLQQILDGLYEGSGECVGVPTLRAGDQIQVGGVGKRFGGTYRLRKVTHTINEEGYRTKFEISQRGNSNLLGLLRDKLMIAPSPVEQEPQYGVVVGKVANNIDPEKLGRLWISLPYLSDENISNWARIASPSTGTFFLPDIGTEVLVGFEQGDLNRPFVLGQLWNGDDRAPEIHLDGLNRLRLIRTPEGHEVRFDDTIGLTKLTITSAGGHTIVLDDTPGTGGVTVTSKGDLNLSGNNVTIQAKVGSLTLKTPGVSATLKGNAMDVTSP